MSDVTLVVGTKSKSSWSLRPWLFLKHHGVPFNEIIVDLDGPDNKKRILQHSPSGKVPVLKHGKRLIWESLAICEYAAENFGLPLAWPMDPEARAFARSIATEMHAGFAELRRELPFSANVQPNVKVVSDAASADIARIRTIWHEARIRFGRGGEFLFGKFGIADAMYAPVALRFQQYSVALDGAERDYMYNILMHNAIHEWLDGAGYEGGKEAPLERTAEIMPRLLQQVNEDNKRGGAPAAPGPAPAVAEAKAKGAPKQVFDPDPNTQPILNIDLEPTPVSKPLPVRSVIMPED